jgi:uncharacterized protein (UPF0147 family)
MVSVDDVITLMDKVINDTMVPRNVRSAVAEAKKIIQQKGDLSVRVSKAVYEIEKVSDEPNMMPHTRTDLWNILSALEALKSGKK